MSRYGTIAAGYWREARSLSERCRLALVYLLTCEHRALGGLFLMPRSYMADDLGWSTDEVRQVLVQLTEAGEVACDADNEWVFLVNWRRHDPLPNCSAAVSAALRIRDAARQAPTNPAVRKGIETLRAEAERLLAVAGPRETSRDKLGKALAEIDYALVADSRPTVPPTVPPTVGDTVGAPPPPPSERGGEVRSGEVDSILFPIGNVGVAPSGAPRTAEDARSRKGRAVTSADAAIPFEQIIDHLNRATGRAFEAGAKETRSLIRARWHEGRRLDDFVAVVDDRTRRWLDDPKMSDCLRPSTLFAKAHFGEYLAAARARPAADLAVSAPLRDAAEARLQREAELAAEGRS